MKDGKTCFGVIIGTRAYFNSELARDVRKQLLKTIEDEGYTYVILPEDATPTGSSSIETREDGLKVSRQFREHREEIDGIIVSLPNFGFEIGIINAISDADLRVPVLVQACDDENDKVDLDSRRDAFCGKISVCNNLYQYGIPFTDTTLHTYSIYSELLAKDLRRFAAICRVVNGLRHCRIGQIGTRPLGFNTCRASEKLLQRYGITVVPVDLSEILSAADLGKEAERYAEILAPDPLAAVEPMILQLLPLDRLMAHGHDLVMEPGLVAPLGERDGEFVAPAGEDGLGMGDGAVRVPPGAGEEVVPVEERFVQGLAVVPVLDVQPHQVRLVAGVEVDGVAPGCPHHCVVYRAGVVALGTQPRLIIDIGRQPLTGQFNIAIAGFLHIEAVQRRIVRSVGKLVESMPGGSVPYKGGEACIDARKGKPLHLGASEAVGIGKGKDRTNQFCVERSKSMVVT